MPDLEQQLQQAIEPLVLELEALRREVAALKAVEPPDVEPLAAEIAALQDDLAALKAAPRVVADDLGPLAADLKASRAELADLKAHRLDQPAWAPGVYRQGVVVQHFHGQYFEAVADTAAEPGDGVAWRRLGLHGFRYRGLYIDGAEYETGDLVARDGSMLLQTAGQLTWLAIRGKRGPAGPAGKVNGGGA